MAIEIVDLPTKNGDVDHSYVSLYQRVDHGSTQFDSVCFWGEVTPATRTRDFWSKRWGKLTCCATLAIGPTILGCSMNGRLVAIKIVVACCCLTKIFCWMWRWVPKIAAQSMLSHQMSKIFSWIWYHQVWFPVDFIGHVIQMGIIIQWNEGREAFFVMVFKTSLWFSMLWCILASSMRIVNHLLLSQNLGVIEKSHLTAFKKMNQGFTHFV